MLPFHPPLQVLGNGMDIKNLAFTEKLPSFKKKVTSGFGLGLLASFIVLTVILLNFSFTTSFLNPVFRGFNNLGSHNSSSTIVSWPFTFPRSGGNIVSNVSLSSRNFSSSDQELNQTFQFNGGSGNVLNFTRFEDGGVILNITHVGNLSGGGGYGSVSGKGKVFGGNYKGGFYEGMQNGSRIGEEGMVKNETFEHGGTVESTGGRNGSSDVRTGGIGLTKSNNNFYGGCDIFDGRWVRDDTKPYYPPGTCPYIDRDFDCYLNGRADTGYVKWKWQPYGCEMPRSV